MKPNCYHTPYGYGRLVTRRNATVALTALATSTLAEADGNRVSIVLSLTETTTPVATNQVQVSAGDGNADPIIAVLTLGRPSVVLTRNDIGDAIMRRIKAVSAQADQVVGVTEVYFTPEEYC